MTTISEYEVNLTGRSTIAVRAGARILGARRVQGRIKLAVMETTPGRHEDRKILTVQEGEATSDLILAGAFIGAVNFGRLLLYVFDLGAKPRKLEPRHPND